MLSGLHDVRQCFCLHTRRAARLLTQFYDNALRPSGLRITQFQLLAAIAEAEPVTQQPLADFLGMDRTTLTRNLAPLQRDGLIRIETGKGDRREHHLHLAPAGRLAVERALPLWRSAQDAVLHRLGTDASSSPGEVYALLGTLSAPSGEGQQ